MSYTSGLEKIGSLALWITIISLGAALERFMNFPGTVTFGAVMFLSALALYPIVKEWEREGRKLAFKSWALSMLLASFIATAILLLINLM